MITEGKRIGSFSCVWCDLQTTKLSTQKWYINYHAFTHTDVCVCVFQNKAVCLQFWQCYLVTNGSNI